MDFRGYYKVSIFIFVIISIISTGILALFIFFRDLFMSMGFINILFLGIGISLPLYLLNEFMIVFPIIKEDMESIKKSKASISKTTADIKTLGLVKEMTDEVPEVLDYIYFEDSEDDSEIIEVNRKSLIEFIEAHLKIKIENGDNEEINKKLQEILENNQIESEEIEALIEEYMEVKNSDEVISKVRELEHNELQKKLEKQKAELSEKEDNIYKQIFLPGTVTYMVNFYVALIAQFCLYPYIKTGIETNSKINFLSYLSIDLTIFIAIYFLLVLSGLITTKISKYVISQKNN